MTLALYDRLTGEVGAVVPRDGDTLTAYVCGPTVYGPIHVGNARPYWFGQVLKRFCERRLGLRVRLVANVTDINDKIYVAARALGVASTELAREMTAGYIADTDRLGLGRPDVEPLASETIDGIVELIERLLERGLAYESQGDVYFRVARFPGYGALSGQRPEELLAGARVEPGESKESPADFALWKAHKPDEDAWWPSPWGNGRPGWHIECSAMASEHLGNGFDVHGGGLDLVFPHHENERAQSEGAGDVPFARRWCHNGMLRLGGDKMSKSEGNVERLRDALDRVGAETLCQFFAGAHYRSPVDYTDESLERAARTNDGLREALRSARRYAAGAAPGPPLEDARSAAEAFDDALADDLDTPRGLAALHGLAGALNRAVADGSAEPGAVSASADVLAACLDVLGLGGLDVRADGAPPEALALAREREEARAARDFAQADALRDRIAALGYTVRDTPQGPELVPLER